MLRSLLFTAVAVYVVGAAAWVAVSGVTREPGLLNVACDPTRELWRDLNAEFARRPTAPDGTRVPVRQSHGGSGSQARSVIDGLDADVATLALFTDTDAVRKAGLIDDGWVNDFPNRSLPFTSTIVFVVRKGNPKRITDWPDLAREDVGVITPNPKTSGNGKWSFLAAWGSVVARGGTDAEALGLVADIYRRAPVLDAAARTATLSFTDKRIGDVHLTWENEAHLEVQESHGGLEIVYPPVSVLAEPHVAVVDRVVDRKGTRAAAEAYLAFLYTEPAQEIIARHHYRPTHEAVRRRTADRFPAIELFAVVPTLGPDWDAVQGRFFAAGGEFDRIMRAR